MTDIVLSDNVVIIQDEDVTFPSGETGHRVVLEYEGHEIQVVEHDDGTSPTVKVDDNISVVYDGDIGGHIARKLSDG